MVRLLLFVLLVGMICGCLSPSERLENPATNRFLGHDSEWVFANFGTPWQDYIGENRTGAATRSPLTCGLDSEYRIVRYDTESGSDWWMEFALVRDGMSGWRVVGDRGTHPGWEWDTRSLVPIDDYHTREDSYVGHDEVWVVSQFGPPDRMSMVRQCHSELTVPLFAKYGKGSVFKQLWYRKHDNDPELIFFLIEKRTGKWVVVADIVIPHGVYF
mgnify:CR=1 FL=1